MESLYDLSLYQIEGVRCRVLRGIGMVTRKISVGTRVRVSDSCPKEDLRKLSGTVMAIYRREERTAIHVRFTHGLWQLLWTEDLERMLECLERRSYSQGLRAKCLGYTAPGLNAVGGDPAAVDASTR